VRRIVAAGSLKNSQALAAGRNCVSTACPVVGDPRSYSWRLFSVRVSPRAPESVCTRNMTYSNFFVT
jgi:hypothetical protein